MAGLLDLFGQRDPNDPVNMGLLGMSAALGTPVRQGGGVGPAFGAFGQGFDAAQNSAARRRLMDAQTQHQLMNSKMGGDNMPAAVKTAEWYRNASPEQKKAFDYTYKAQIFDVGGIKYLRTPEGNIPLVDLPTAANNEATIAGAKEGATQRQRAAYTQFEGVDPTTNRPIQTSLLDMLIRNGLVPGDASSPLSTFNPASAAVGKPRSKPNEDAAGLNPDGYPSIEGPGGLRAALDRASGVPGGRFGGGGPIAPKVAGEADREGDKAIKAGIVKDIIDSAAAARGASQSIQSIARINDAIDKGVIAGPGQNPRQIIARVGQMFGAGGKDEEELLKNTTEMMQGFASLSVKGASQLQGQGQVSNFERQMVEKAASGDLNMTVPELKALLSALEKVNRYTIEQHNSKLKRVPKTLSEDIQYYSVDMPPQVTQPTQPMSTTSPAQQRGGRRINSPIEWDGQFQLEGQ